MRTKNLFIAVAALTLLSGRALVGVPAQDQDEDKAKAENWIAQADSTKALVEGVLASAIEAGAEEHPVASGQVADAQSWLGEGARALATAKEALAAEDYERAANVGNMAWQYYVKAGTAAVLAAKLVSGGKR
ncbi:MAG: hypothetical protein GTO46_16390 [Gemmatimonadetes bacterium]|nr:hypothetical protein [Gemmatimonadota bacterium]NIO33287.1 hypothetical protein [Gemmatimonadota bacterium]